MSRTKIEVIIEVVFILLMLFYSFIDNTSMALACGVMLIWNTIRHIAADFLEALEDY